MPSTSTLLSSPRLLKLLASCCLALAALLPGLRIYWLWATRGGPPVDLDGRLRIMLICLGLLPVLGLAYGLVRAARRWRGMRAANFRPRHGPPFVRLDVKLAVRKAKSKDLAEYIGITEANLSLLKQGVRFRHSAEDLRIPRRPTWRPACLPA